MCSKRVLALVGFLSVASTTSPSIAADSDADSDRQSDPSVVIAERVYVVGTREKKERIPGSASLIEPQQLEELKYTDIHRMLRLVPGVNIQEEDGYGLRPNIGLRGSGSERSSRITLMEDGVLIAPAPYAAPSAYYFPTAGRMSAIEVRKGSAAVKFGPRTVGGALNLVSTPIPEETGGKGDFRFGSDDFYVVHVNGAYVGEKVAAFVETYQSGSDGFKKLDGGGDTGFSIQDYVVKLRYSNDKSADVPQSFELKLGYTENNSNETYLGLTDADFAATPYRRYAASQNDRMETEHKQIQLTHYIEPADNIDITTIGYFNKFARDWFKLDDLDFGEGRFRPSSVFGDPDAYGDVLAVLRGEADSIDDALQLRHNNRSYESWGIQTVMGIGFNTGSARHDLEIGLRWHEDHEDRLQNREKFRMESGQMILTSVDATGTQGNRIGSAEAFAAFVQDEIVTGRWTIMPGLRFEKIKTQRLDFASNDPDRSAGPTGMRQNNVDAVIPGIGATFQATDELTILAGVHRGFAPPGTSSRDGQASVEKSWSYEFGLRYRRDMLYLEVIGFFNDYGNILGNCTNASGCTGDIGDTYNGGEAEVKGLEAVMTYDIVLANGMTMPFAINYTYTDTKFNNSFEDGFWGDVLAGDEMPYIPEHQLHVSLGVEAAKWGATLGMTYVGTIRTEAGQGPAPVMERVDDHIVFDLSAYYQLNETIRIFATADNLFDKKYAVARRPYGLRPGKPFSVVGGFSLGF